VYCISENRIKHGITTAMMIFWLSPKTSHSLGRYDPAEKQKKKTTKTKSQLNTL